MKPKTKKSSYLTLFGTRFFCFNRKFSLIVFFLLSILIFSTFVVAVGRSSAVKVNCADKLCQIDEVWLKVQEKLATKLGVDAVKGKGWAGGKVWKNNEWKTFEEVYPKGVAEIPHEEEEREPETPSEEWLNKFQKDNLLPLGIRQPTVSEGTLKEMYGDCRQDPAASCNPATRLCSENTAYVSANIVSIDFLGKNVRVHKKLADIFQAADAEIKEKFPGYHPKSIGGYICRVIGGTKVMSSHAFGVTVDIDPLENPFYSRPSGTSCTTTIPQEVVQVFKKHGFCWGGQFGNVCDAMHFEYCRPEGIP